MSEGGSMHLSLVLGPGRYQLKNTGNLSVFVHGQMQSMHMFMQ